MPPKEPGKCDGCGGRIVQRQDDSEETVLERLKVYEAQTADVLEFYKAQGLLAQIDGALAVEDSYPAIAACLRGAP
jgi:adenylate kinase